MRRTPIAGVVVAVALAGAGQTIASPVGLSPTPERVSEQLAQRYNTAYDRAKGKLGVEAVGRNLHRDGFVRSDGSVRDASPLDLRVSLERLRAMIAPAAPTSSPAAAPAAPAAGPVATGAPLAAIAACESGGDYSAVSPDGTYRGAYQFDYGTWASVGGSGDPAAASPAEQDQRAAMLYARSGSAPWPICGQ